MGLIKASIFVLLIAVAAPLAFRTFAPDLLKAQLNAYVSQHKTVDQVIKKASDYFDLTFDYANVQVAKDLIDNVKRKVDDLIQSQLQSHQKDSKAAKESPQAKQRMVTCQGEPQGILLMTKDELAKFDGSAGSKGLYLAFMGSIYDVSKNKKHYQPGGDYAFFSAKDATRAFLTGVFEPQELNDNLKGVADEQLSDVDHWLKFYKDEYPFVGRVVGNFYDNKGCPSNVLEKVLKVVSGVNHASNEIEEFNFPECNSEWNSDTKKSRVWCSKMSGGIERDWVGVPRKLYTPDSKSFRCVCVRNFGPSSSATDDTGANNGDLEHPRLKQYKDCDPKANECQTN
ncbi:Neuferricin, partial [Fragariocoptes setiger]